MSDKFEQSLASGPHAFLLRLAGSWEGTARTWFKPDELADESALSGAIQPVLAGRFVIHAYASTLQGEPYTGVAVHGYDLQRECYTTAWIDSFHNGTGIMLSQGQASAGEPYSVLGSYRDPGGGPDWGWRTTLEQPAADRLLIIHYNITPDGQAAKAVEFDYQRRPPSSLEPGSDVL